MLVVAAVMVVDQVQLLQAEIQHQVFLHMFTNMMSTASVLLMVRIVETQRMQLKKIHMS